MSAYQELLESGGKRGRIHNATSDVLCSWLLQGSIHDPVLFQVPILLQDYRYTFWLKGYQMRLALCCHDSYFINLRGSLWIEE